MRFLTSMAMAGLPSRRVIVSASLKVERTVARSLDPHDGIRAGDDRQVGDILRRLDQRRHLDRVFAFRAFDRAGGDKAVRSADALDQLVELQSVGGQLHRIDDRFDQIVARSPGSSPSRTPGTSSMRSRSVLGGGGQRAFRDVAGQRDERPPGIRRG